MATNDEDNLITQAEAARLRGVTRSAIGYLIAQGRLQTYDRYGMRFVSRQEVLNYAPLKPGPSPKSKAGGTDGKVNVKPSKKGSRK